MFRFILLFLTLCVQNTIYAKDLSFTLKERSELQVGTIYYVQSNRLLIRSSDVANDETKLARLSRNDQVRVIDASENFNDDYVQVELVKTAAPVPASPTYFLSYKYLGKNRYTLKNIDTKYFMIQNIASETLRLYEKKCDDGRCQHKMVLEADMAAGEDDDGVRTLLGSYRLTYKKKFYEDRHGSYPAWYKPGYPELPKPSKGAVSWTRKKYMPKVNGKAQGNMRGAFGWYALFIGPNHDGQWTHGTIGWGENKDEFIQKTKKLAANFFTDPRSHGCSRTDNETIAYLNHLLDVGTPVVKIYAKEALKDPFLTQYQDNTMLTWDYTLTTRGPQTVNGQTADRETVYQSGIQFDEILDEGTYIIDNKPDVREFKRSGYFRRKRGKGANIYGIKPEQMQGVFYIDTGILDGYAHPVDKKINAGGYKDELAPAFMIRQYTH